ncbi:MAG: prenyltransferase [Thaumarchaeota archaeon]|nr:prenyltransferase [Nitrososphaerota archaeon]
MDLAAWFLATRPWSFTMTIVGVAIASSLAASVGVVEPQLTTLVLIGLVLFHAAANMLNDYFDVKRRVDRPDAPTAKYRPHPFLAKQIPSRSFLCAVAALYLLVVVAIIYAWIIRGALVLLFAIPGLFFSVFYTADPIHLKYRALGEFSVFLVWGPIMVTGAYYVLTARIEITPMLVSLPHGIWVALVLLANNTRDIEYDRGEGIKTLPILLGKDRSLKVFQLLVYSTYLIVVALVITGILTALSLLTFLTLPAAVRLARTFRRALPDTADPMTAKLTLQFGALLALGIYIGTTLPV